MTVFRDACRGIDVDGSVADTDRRLAAMGVPVLAAEAAFA